MLRKTAYVFATCGLLICLLMASERPAYAYVDPGSGLFLVQGIGSAFLGVFYVIRRKLKLGKWSNAQASQTEKMTMVSEAAKIQPQRYVQAKDISDRVA